MSDQRWGWLVHPSSFGARRADAGCIPVAAPRSIRGGTPRVFDGRATGVLREIVTGQSSSQWPIAISPSRPRPSKTLGVPPKSLAICIEQLCTADDFILAADMPRDRLV